MFKIIQSILLPLIVLLVGTYFIKEFMDDKAKLIYTISDSVPIKNPNSKVSLNVQQLTISNFGDIPAKDIQIKLNGNIVNFELKKNVFTDSPSSKLKATEFSSNYENLPPGGIFSYVFQISDKKIQINNISIIHSKGKASNISETNNYSRILDVIWYLVLFSYLIVTIRNYFQTSLYIKMTSHDHRLLIDILSVKQPFYVSNNNWKSLREQVINNKSSFESYKDINQDEGYTTLNSTGIEILTASERALVISSMSQRLSEMMSYKVKVSTTTEHLNRLLSITKPLHFDTNKWKEIRDNIQKEFYVILRISSYNPTSLSEIIDEIDKPPPLEMDIAEQRKYLRCLKSQYFIFMVIDLITGFLAGLNRNTIDLVDMTKINDEDKNKIEDIVYKLNLVHFQYQVTSLISAENLLKQKDMGKNISKNDKEALILMAESYLQLDKDSKALNQKHKFINYIISKQEIGVKPDNIKIESWNELQQLESEIVTAAQDNNENKKHLLRQSADIEKLKIKVTTQLSIINRLLEEPDSILRLEDYNNPFSAGNYQNLITLSKKMKKYN